jgi:hypothetical protein
VVVSVTGIAPVSAAAVAVAVADEPPNTLTAKERADGWRLLFDGKTTGGWRGYRQQTAPDGWQAVDGALTRVAEGADLITVDQFADFELAIDWKVPPNGNSGVLYRVTEDDDVSWKTAPEYQVIDNAYKGLKPAQFAGSNYDLHPPLRDVTKPVGSWNETRIVARGPHVEHWLNGVKIVDYELWSDDWQKRMLASKFKDLAHYAKAKKGYIGLQNHGDRVAFRSIRIRQF